MGSKKLPSASTPEGLETTTMRQVYNTRELEIPADVECDIKSKVVTVKGPRGTLTRDLSHLQVDLFKTEIDGKPHVKVEVWHGTSKRLAGTRTVISHINNMFLGVTRGFRYSMRLVYAHFPINVTIEDAGKTIEIRNFLGEKRVRIVRCWRALPSPRTRPSRISSSWRVTTLRTSAEAPRRSTSPASSEPRTSGSSWMVSTSTARDTSSTQKSKDPSGRAERTPIDCAGQPCLPI